MLVLSRKAGEKIVIAGNITVTIVKLRDDRVQVGIEAPPEVPVHRQEVYDRLHAQTIDSVLPPRRWSERDLLATR
jgi:carbon storage regulator